MTTALKSAIAQAWIDSAADLTKWVEDNLVVRRDAHGRYGKDGKSWTAKESEGDPLTSEVIAAHFKAKQPGHAIGLYPIFRNRLGQSLSRWLAIDIDRHSDSDNPDANERFAKSLYTIARGLGINPVLTDSNGNGGYHLLLIFDRNIATEKVYAFARSIALGDWKTFGVTKEPETYPKQETISDDKPYGNFIRLFGRHHKRPHYSRVWDGDRWLAGSEAITSILTTQGASPDAIEDADWIITKKDRQTILSDYELAKDALRFVEDMANDYTPWSRIGMALTPLGNDGLRLWTEWSRSSKKYKEGECEKKWKTFTIDGNSDLKLGTLFFHARKSGWKMPTGGGPRPSSNGAHHQNGKTQSADKEKETQSEILLRLAEPVEVYRTPAGLPYATFPEGEHTENHPIRSTSFRRWLIRAFYHEQHRPPSTDAFEGVLRVLESQAEFDGGTRVVTIRVAEDPRANEPVYFLDLADDDWRVVQITAEGWRLVDRPRVRFRRARGMSPLPVPLPGGRLDDLRSFVNLASDDDWRLLVAAITAALRPVGPFPIIAVSGEQGSAKTTMARLVRRLVDPNVAPVRSEPKDDRDLMIAASNSWIVSLDNLSSLQPWMSDALCRLSTGGGFATRALFENDEETIFDAMRPIILNGVEDIATRPDLLDRCILLSLPRIPDDRRVEERQYWAEFADIHPKILGALLDAVAGGIRELPRVRLDSMPRMADFARWGEAVGRHLGWGDLAFLDAYEANRSTADETAVENSPVARAVRELMEKGNLTEWNSAPGELLTKLETIVGEKGAKARSWPTAANALSGRLRRAAPALRRIGISVDLDQRSGGKRTIRILRESSPATDPSNEDPDRYY